MQRIDHAGLLRSMRGRPIRWALLAAMIALLAWRLTAQRDISRAYHPPIEPTTRRGDEIAVCGHLFHTGTPVILWTDPGGYDGYQPSPTTKPATLYGDRDELLDPAERARVLQTGWDLPLLQAKVQQFVIHYDAAGTSRECFHLLHDQRGLSVHFLLDIDGTIYQTLDLRERAWHATTANGRSIGIEIANRGAVPSPALLAEWYTKDAQGLRITIPARVGDPGIRTPNFVGRPATPHIVRGEIQGQILYQYDLTDQQYQALAHLTATLCQVLPRITCDYPHNAAGQLITTKLPDDVLANYRGLLGHYHVQRDKQDPGPAFQWPRLINDARKLMSHQPAQLD